MALPLIMGGLAIAKGAFDAYGAEKNRKNQIAGLRKMSEVTPAERAYEKRRQDIIKGGDPLINEAGREAIQTVRQQGQFNQQRATGQAINQGLENSIVAQELRRKVDADTLRSVAKQARQMALANAQAKRQAEGELESFRMGIDDRKRTTNAKIAGIGGYDRWGTLGNIAMSGLGAYASAGGDFGMKGAMPWDDISSTALKGMSDNQMTVFLESMDPKQQMKFIEYYEGL